MSFAGRLYSIVLVTNMFALFKPDISKTHIRLKKLRWARIYQVAGTYTHMPARKERNTKTAWNSLAWLFGETSGQSLSNTLDGFQAMYV
jgi:hypothetical protein